MASPSALPRQTMLRLLLTFASAAGGLQSLHADSSDFVAEPPLDSGLAAELRAAVLPQLRSLSATHNDSAWSFAYKDAEAEVRLCVGTISKDGGRNCTADDTFAFGSTTKPITATLLLQLAERGLLDLDAPVAPLVDPLLASMARGASLAAIYGPEVTNVSARLLLSHRSGISEYDGVATRRYQNDHPGVDLSPLWVLQQASLLNPPGTAALGEYSSTGYTLAGLVAAAALNVSRWDRLDQFAALAPAGETLFPATRFPVHGPCRRFETARGEAGGTSAHGYENPRLAAPLGAVDTFNLSCTQGWTCGNLVSTPRDVARFFWHLLRPPARGAAPLLSPASLAQMRAWRPTKFRPEDPRNFSYGLGLMDFNSMDWGFEYNGSFVGHNGLTYGFGSQSGYNAVWDFALSYVNNAEFWIGPPHPPHPPGPPHPHPHPHPGPPPPDALYAAVVAVVRRHRETTARQSAAARAHGPPAVGEVVEVGLGLGR